MSVSSNINKAHFILFIENYSNSTCTFLFSGDLCKKMLQTSGMLLILGARTTQQLILMKTNNYHKVWCVSFYIKRCLLHNTWLDILMQNLQKACVLRFACPVVSFTSVINLLSGCSSESSISPLQPFSYMYAAAIFHHKFKGIKIEND